jgi:hypothetical protein
MTKILFRLCLSAFLPLAVFILGSAGASAQTAPQNGAVLILDHSSSMWSKLEGTPKINILRSTVTPLLNDFASKLKLGIIAYGTAKAKNCDGVDTLKTMGAIDAGADIKAINAANPKGSAPVAASLNAASKMLESQSGAQTIILVSDSADECKADPCAAAEKLKAQSPRMIIHVVAFAGEIDEKLESLSCIAEQTGGVFLTAQSNSELDASLRKALQLASLGASEDVDGRLIPAVPEAAGAAQPSVGTPTSNVPGTLALSAVLAKDTPPLSSGLIWRIYDVRVQDDGSYRLLHKLEEARPSITLPPGDYLVNSAYGQANVTKRLAVWPEKKIEDVFNLNAGGLKLYATLAKQPLYAEQALTFDVYSQETDQYGNRRKVISGAKSGVVMRLNSGSYRVESTYGDANATMEADVTVEPGKLTEATIDHQAGRVTFRLVEKPGGEALADTIWQIFASDGQFVKKSGGAFPSHILAAGNYDVKVEHSGKQFAAKFTVVPGDKKQVEVVMP